MNIQKSNFSIVSLYTIIAIIGFILGIKLYISGNFIDLKHSANAFLKDPNNIFHNFIKKDFKGETLELYISKNKFAKLSNDRYHKMINAYYLIPQPISSQSSVKCKMYYDNRIIKAKVKIAGAQWDHFSNPNKWSLRIKLKGENAFKSTSQFNLLLPKTRGYLFDYLLNQISKDYNIISIGYEPIKVYINGEDWGVYLFEDFFNKYLIEKNRKKDSMIFTFHNNKIYLNHPSIKKLNEEQKQLIKKIENDILNHKLIFDEQKLTIALAIGFLFDSHHHLTYNNLHWYYNPHTNLLEPIIREAWPHEKNITENNFEYKQIIKSLDNLLIHHNPYILEYFKNNLLNENNVSDFHEILIEIINKYEKYSESSEFLDFYEILNNESVVSSWVTNIGKERVEKAKIAIHNHFKNNFINNDLLSPRDSVYLSGKIVMNETMLYQDDDLLVINEGTTLELKNSANIIIKGGLQINGTKINPVIIKNIDSTNSSIIILQSPDTVKINFTKFFNLSSLSYDNWINTASLTFYNSNVIIKNSEFFNNSKGDDFVNIVSANSFIIDNCLFSNVISDAIDIDFSNGAISNSRFEYCGNDAIDVSGSEIIIYNCKVANCNDKAISCGEASSVTINECDIKNSKYGIVSKDLSNVRSNNSAFHNNNYDFSVYQKKAEYGIASLIEKNSIGATKALISSTSKFFSNNNKIAVIINDSLINTLNH